ncbi:mitochondrial/chloroplast ribosomal protein S14/S29 [Moesziomyces antarcticus T-34]|uniref:Mitochondrial/chloroplast ribosomal protein S14/S29 n=1 Tax=Pseudozyma antarctica (strain T-34) TaxID=1151754 RepID=M9LSJ6_PSEA3|nr:mitochondrial/chloroplast ribosomal protein S14/S29 [Moesziomyces antarcticus T-34]
MPVRPNARVLRDMATRQAVQSNELVRRAFKYIARNTTLPQKVRHQAQLQLNQFPNKTRPVSVSNRCVETGRGRGIISEFGLCRVSFVPRRPYQFRMKALANELPGVKKASW